MAHGTWEKMVLSIPRSTIIELSVLPLYQHQAILTSPWQAT
jgi:hypothetical protein